ncbi:hypothetical protein DL93DRAFT_2090623 [Clavulina sp. PMI_390]|nr:hypothetical protein DL93DRAFT_2090623 [Clavulina sp. PMI_390]
MNASDVSWTAGTTSTVQFSNLTTEYATDGYTMAAPPTAAVVVGLILASIIMGVVTIQLASYTSRFYKERKIAVLIINIVFLWNAICLILLAYGLHHCLSNKLKTPPVHNNTLPQKYILIMTTNVLSRAVVSYAVALLTAYLFHSGLIGVVLNVFLATRLDFRWKALTAYVLQAIYHSFGKATASGQDYPPLVKANTVISFSSECIVCVLLLGAICRKNEKRKENSFVARLTRHAIPSYLFTVCVAALLDFRSLSPLTLHHQVLVLWICSGMPVATIPLRQV